MEALGHYLVELHRPPGGWDGLQRLAAQARGTAEQLTAEGTPVRFLRSIFVPDEDSCFLLYAAASADAVGEAGRRAALAVERIDTAVGVDRAPTTKVSPSYSQGGNQTIGTDRLGAALR